MQFRQIQFNSEEYFRARALREAVLRIPLGLELKLDDLQGESDQLHFGLFADDSELVASVTAVIVSADQAKIRQTAVLPSCRSKGLGRKMMLDLEAVLAAKGVEMLVLNARSTAVGFYEKLGYAVVGDEFVEVTIVHRKMVKKLC